MRFALALGVLALSGSVPASAAADPERYMPVRLIAESQVPKPGSTILIGFRMTPKPGWHGYWSNPGDSGIAPTVTWSAPAGVTFGPLKHPAPTLLTAAGISSYVHEREHILLSRMTVPRTIPSGTPIPIAADLNWAACTATQCVPLHAKLILELRAGDGSPSNNRAALCTAAERLPRSAPDGLFVESGKSLRLMLPQALGLQPARTRFFAEQPGAFNTAGARSQVADGSVVLTGPAGSAEPDRMTGVVADGRRAYRITLVRTADLPVADAPEKAAREPTAAMATNHAAQPEPQAQVRPGRQKPDPSPSNSTALAVTVAALIGAGGLAWLLRATRR
jgi:DsbC/DsbD-like thiol-disulfide interchange protein